MSLGLSRNKTDFRSRKSSELQMLDNNKKKNNTYSCFSLDAIRIILWMFQRFHKNIDRGLFDIWVNLSYSIVPRYCVMKANCNEHACTLSIITNVMDCKILWNAGHIGICKLEKLSKITTLTRKLILPYSTEAKAGPVIAVFRPSQKKMVNFTHNNGFIDWFIYLCIYLCIII